MQLQELKKFEEEHKAIRQQLSRCNDELKSLQQAGERHTSAQQKCVHCHHGETHDDIII